jgi:hypothetical protein
MRTFLSFVPLAFFSDERRVVNVRSGQSGRGNLLGE